jgi:hypothetical protein
MDAQRVVLWTKRIGINSSWQRHRLNGTSTIVARGSIRYSDQLRFIAALFINMNFLFVLMVCAVVVIVVEGQSKEEAWRVYKVTQSTFKFWRFNQILVVFQ